MDDLPALSEGQELARRLDKYLFAKVCVFLNKY